MRVYMDTLSVQEQAYTNTMARKNQTNPKPKSPANPYAWPVDGILCYLCQRTTAYGATRPKDDIWAPCFLCQECMKRPDIIQIATHWKAEREILASDGKYRHHSEDSEESSYDSEESDNPDERDLIEKWRAVKKAERLYQYELCYCCEESVYTVRRNDESKDLLRKGWRLWCRMCVKYWAGQLTVIRKPPGGGERGGDGTVTQQLTELDDDTLRNLAFWTKERIDTFVRVWAEGSVAQKKTIHKTGRTWPNYGTLMKAIPGATRTMLMDFFRSRVRRNKDHSIDYVGGKTDIEKFTLKIIPESELKLRTVTSAHAGTHRRDDKN